MVDKYVRSVYALAFEEVYNNINMENILAEKMAHIYSYM